MGPCDASSHRHAYVISGKLLPAHPVGASPGRALVTLVYIGTPTPPSDVSYRRPQLMAPARTSSIGMPLPPPVVLYQLSPLVHPLRGALVTPFSVGTTMPHPVLTSSRTQEVNPLGETLSTPFPIGTLAPPLPVSYRHT